MGLAAFNRARRLRAEQAETQPAMDNGLAQLRERGKELGIPRASQMGEKKLLEAIAAKEAEQEVKKEAELDALLDNIVETIESAESGEADDDLPE